jgi:transposase InsO family protein
MNKDISLRDKIAAIHRETPVYGYRRIKAVLAKGGEQINHKRIRRVMNQYGLFTKIPRSFKNTTQSRHEHKRYPNLTQGISIRSVNIVWATDITYIRLGSGFVFLAAVLDLYSRKVVGWAIGPHINQELTIAALDRAIALRKPLPGCIHHSDQGVQYCAEDYIALLKKHGFRISMSRTGNPYDNAFVESFMRTLKMEEVYLSQYRSFQHVAESVSYFIEEVYNQKRLHSSLGYISPAEYETKHWTA